MLDGRKIGVLPSTQQYSLFLGNLPKEWSPDEFDRVVRQVFQDVDSVNLVMMSSDGVTPSTHKQQNRGFGFVQFSSHAAAGRAYRLSSKSEFVLGGKCHPTVQWAEEEPEIDPDEFAKVKIAFIRNLPADVTEGFLRKLFGPFGEIEKVVLSKKGQSQVGFVHYAKRQDLDSAIKGLHDRTVQGPNSGLFKLQVEVARPFEKNKKRAREGSSRVVTDVTQSKVLKADSGFSSGGHVLKVREEHVGDPYEAAVVSLPAAVQDRLLRILRLDIATRYDIDIRCLRSLKEIPESAAISVLDQFLLSGGEEIDKGAFLAGLITKYQIRSLRTSQLPEYTSREDEYVSARSELARLPSRSQVPVVDSFSSHVATSRYEKYSPNLPYFDYSPSPRAGITRTFEERNTSPVYFPGSSSYGNLGLKSPILRTASHQPTRPQVRFDPYTGEPYKFDPYTGEPIQPETLSRGGRSLY
ncbi:probable RNA-binding protein 46 isoform X2 [Chenopodium quinoa]|uniref:RRM domain-containing protein n=2 Tax=Chenopodium quinoa TaxID=63459 RepID=A0A803LSI0_CHEQI|nr:probable RNA-binding protein 46 isoform X2 [Chenopodium quinoa]